MKIVFVVIWLFCTITWVIFLPLRVKTAIRREKTSRVYEIVGTIAAIGAFASMIAMRFI